LNLFWVRSEGQFCAGNIVWQDKKSSHQKDHDTQDARDTITIKTRKGKYQQKALKISNKPNIFRLGYRLGVQMFGEITFFQVPL